MSADFQSDIDAVAGISVVPTILDVVCATTGMGFAAVARVTEDRWITCQLLDKINFGLKPGDELKVETTLCHEVRQHSEPIIINNVAEDDAYCDHHTPAMYGFQSYISMPIMLPNGTFFGTLCAIDPRPAQLNSPQIVGMFKLFADLIGFHLHTENRLAESDLLLKSERGNSELREQFIAVLGHDLRNPLASLGAGAAMLLRTQLDDRAKNIVTLMQSTTLRMNGLVDNLMDFARGRLGGGLTLERETKSLTHTLSQVIDEVRSAVPDRQIETSFDVLDTYDADHGRLAQLFSNLLGNAVTHGAADRPVRVEAVQNFAGLKLSVSNSGEPIPPEALKMLFLPFNRGRVRPSLQGLGLGLFIASEISRAHGGRLTVASSPEETRFTLTIPPSLN